MKAFSKISLSVMAIFGLLSANVSASEIAEDVTIIEVTEVEELVEFDDVKHGDLYYEEIQYLLKLGTINGYDDGTFKPLNNVNRAEMVKVVATSVQYRFSEYGDDVFEAYEDQSCFSDVTAGEWHSKYICFAKDHDWIKGYDDGSFKPDQRVTFVEALKIAFMGFDLEYSEATDPWYQEMVDRALYYAYIPETIGEDYGEYLNRGELAALIRMMVVFDPDAICPLSDHFTDSYYSEDDEA